MKPEIGWAYIIAVCTIWACFLTWCTSTWIGPGFDIGGWERIALNFAFGVTVGRLVRVRGWS